MITDNQGYDAAYYLLEKYYSLYGPGEKPMLFDLETLLNSMVPMDDTVPYDPASWIDWLATLEEEDIFRDMDKGDVLRATRAFTQKYVRTFGFDLGEVPKRLQEITPDDLDLTEAIQKAEAACRAEKQNTRHLMPRIKDKPGHAIDTPATETSLEDATQDLSNPPVRPEGEDIQRDGTQVWVYTRNGLIEDCGVNKTAPDNKTPSEKKIMTDNQAYHVAYYLLEKYHHVYGLGGEFRSFDLGSLLTFMAPVSDRDPLDPAYWVVWLATLEEEGIIRDMDKGEVLRATRAFTQKYIHEFGFDLGEVPKRLQEITADDPDLAEAIQKAKAACRAEKQDIRRLMPRTKEQLYKPGHLVDTPANRAFLENATKDASKYIGVHREGSDVYAYMRKDGTQVWVYSRDGIIQNGGVYTTPRTIEQLLGRK
jgi:hypothetical protein